MRSPVLVALLLFALLVVVYFPGPDLLVGLLRSHHAIESGELPKHSEFFGWPASRRIGYACGWVLAAVGVVLASVLFGGSAGYHISRWDSKCDPLMPIALGGVIGLGIGSCLVLGLLPIYLGA